MADLDQLSLMVGLAPTPANQHVAENRKTEKERLAMAEIDPKWTKDIIRKLPGYPWLPCPVCKSEGYPNAVGSCDHTALERARAALPSLHLPEQLAETLK